MGFSSDDCFDNDNGDKDERGARRRGEEKDNDEYDTNNNSILNHL